MKIAISNTIVLSIMVMMSITGCKSGNGGKEYGNMETYYIKDLLSSPVTNDFSWNNIALRASWTA